MQAGEGVTLPAGMIDVFAFRISGPLISSLATTCEFRACKESVGPSMGK